MHIVHVCLHFNTKIEYQELALAREQIRTGHKVTVVTSEWHPNFKNYESIYKPVLGQRHIGTGVFLEENITIYRLKLLNRPSIFRRLKGAVQIINKIQPDLVICHGFEVGLLLFQATHAKCKIIVDSHQMPLHSRELSKISKAKFNLNNLLSKIKGLYIQLHKRVVCVGVTEDSIDYLSSSYCPKKRIHLIPLGADTTCFFPDKLIREKTREVFKFKENDVVLIFTGKVQENKGVHYIIESMAHLASEGTTNLSIFIIGSGPSSYLKKLHTIIGQNSLGSKVNIIDFTDKVTLNKYFNASDVAVYPKEVTISHMEAMAVGLPIIIEKLNGIQHRIKSGNGYGICSLEELTSKLKELSIDKELRIKMGALSLKLITEKYNWVHINQKFLQI